MICTHIDHAQNISCRVRNADSILAISAFLAYAKQSFRFNLMKYFHKIKILM